jgi:chromosome segregation ATPase
MLSVDGHSINAAVGAARAINSENNMSSNGALTMEINELKRKVERKDTELKRKDKELLNASKDNSRLQSELKLALTDISCLQRANEQLNETLNKIRVLGDGISADGAEKLIDKNKIRELEDIVLMGKQKILRLEEVIERNKSEITALEKSLRVTENANSSNNITVKELQREIKIAIEKENKFSSDLIEKCREIELLRGDVNTCKRNEQNLKDQIDKMQEELARYEQTIETVTKERKEIEDAMAVRHELNQELRAQLEEFHGSNVVISSSELSRYKLIETENIQLKSRNAGLVKSVDLHMSLLQKSEAEIEALKRQIADEQAQKASTLKEMDKYKHSMSVHEQSIKALKQEVVKSRKTVKIYLFAFYITISARITLRTID